MDDLERLGDLHSKGLLSDEEFGQMKAQLLASATVDGNADSPLVQDEGEPPPPPPPPTTASPQEQTTEASDFFCVTINPHHRRSKKELTEFLCSETGQSRDVVKALVMNATTRRGTPIFTTWSDEEARRVAERLNGFGVIAEVATGSEVNAKAKASAKPAKKNPYAEIICRGCGNAGDVRQTLLGSGSQLDRTKKSAILGMDIYKTNRRFKCKRCGYDWTESRQGLL